MTAAEIPVAQLAEPTNAQRLRATTLPRARSNVSRAVAALVLLVTFTGCMWMYTVHNAFPYQYHPDEGGKGSQVLSPDGERNFNHPQLLLEATHWVIELRGVPHDNQRAVEAGRLVSATCAALAVVALSLCAYLATGLPGLIAVTPVVALCPFLYAHTHFMKEDAALVFGIAIATLGARLMWDWGRRPVLMWIAVVVLATGFATATSAKYVGAGTAALAVLALGFAPRRNFPVAMMRPIVFLSYGLFLVLLINHRAIRKWDAFTDGLDREIDHSLSDHAGLTMSQPNGFALDSLLIESPNYVLITAAIGLTISLIWWPGWIGSMRAWFARRVHANRSSDPPVPRDALNRRPMLGWDRCMWIFAGLFLLLVSYGVIPMPRYALPVVVLVAMLSGVGAARLGQLIGRRWAIWGVPVLFACVTIGVQGPKIASYIKQTGDDGRQRLRDFLRTDAMRGSVVAADFYCGLNAPPYNGISDDLYQRVQVRSFYISSDRGTLERLRGQGVTHVAVTPWNYERYFDTHVFPTPEFRYQYGQLRTFYKRIAKEGTLVWANEPKHPIRSYTNPPIQLYDIRNR